MPFLLDFAVLALIFVLLLRKYSYVSRSSLLSNALMYLYLCGVLYFTLMPVIASLPYCFSHPYTPMCMTPFRDAIMGYGDYTRQIVLNVIMTVPFGFLLPLCRSVCGKTCGFLRCLLYTAVMSLAIELLQPLINASRSSDITDLITNIFGGTVGYTLFLIVKKAKNA